MCLRNCNLVFVEDLSFWRINDVIKVLEKFGLYRNGLFLLEHPFILLCYGWSQIKQIYIQVRFIFFRR